MYCDVISRNRLLITNELFKRFVLKIDYVKAINQAKKYDKIVNECKGTLLAYINVAWDTFIEYLLEQLLRALSLYDKIRQIFDHKWE